MKITERRLRSIIRSVIKESESGNQDNKIEIQGIVFNNFIVTGDGDGDISAEYTLDDEKYSHNNLTGSYESIADDIMDVLKEKKLLKEKTSEEKEKINLRLDDIIKDKYYKSLERLLQSN
tara:strand:- start:338 stop:697 length:360 start_codon:yes stop_codon:yes gene_type:complete